MTAALVLSVVLVAGPAAELEKKAAPAREKAIGYLKKQQKADGTWEVLIGTLADMEGGSTALVTLALLEAGVPPDDPAVAGALLYLAKLEPKRTYVVSLQTQVFAKAEPKSFRKQIQANADWLLRTAIRRGGRLDGWSYPQNDIPDGSNTHFAVVALHAAVQAGAKVDEKVWAEVRDLYARAQLNAGAWAYYSERLGGGDASSLSMTGAALVGLSLAAKQEPAGKPDPAFEKGMAWYVPEFRFESAKSTGYNMMVAAELGRSLGRREFTAGRQTRAWYREGVEKLVKEQKEDGSWATGKSIDGDPALATAFALYFLGPPAGK
jgi:hypothetical protein